MRELCGPAEGSLEGRQLDMVRAAAGQQDGGRPAGGRGGKSVGRAPARAALVGRVGSNCRRAQLAWGG